MILVIIEIGLKNQPHNEEFKIILLKLYAKLGSTTKVK